MRDLRRRAPDQIGGLDQPAHERQAQCCLAYDDEGLRVVGKKLEDVILRERRRLHEGHCAAATGKERACSWSGGRTPRAWRHLFYAWRDGVTHGGADVTKCDVGEDDVLLVRARENRAFAARQADSNLALGAMLSASSAL